MDETKSIFMSKTFWGAMLALAGGILHLFGVDFPEEEQANIAEQIVGAAPYVMELAGAILAVVGRMTATKQATVTGAPKVDVPMGGGLQAHWLATIGAAGLALLLMGGLAGCDKDPATGAPRTTGERIAVGLEYFLAAATIIDAATPDDEPGVTAALLDRIDRGIAIYCTLPPASQDVMIADIDPAVLAVAVRHRGGADGDVCTEPPAASAPAAPP